jgi:hypothetical protein
MLNFCLDLSAVFMANPSHPKRKVATMKRLVMLQATADKKGI